VNPANSRSSAMVSDAVPALFMTGDPLIGAGPLPPSYQVT
jgi:hypothetical protein